MTKLIPLSRAAATAAAALGAYSLACAGASPALAKGAASSAEDAPLNLSSGAPAAHASAGGASIVRTVVGLAIVIAVIWGLTWILRQVKAGRDPQVRSAGELASVAALTLSAGRSVHLVRAGTEYVLLASAEHGVAPIHRYSEQEARDAGLLPPEEPEPEARRSPLAPRPTRDGNGHRHSRVAAPPGGLVGRMREMTVRR